MNQLRDENDVAEMLARESAVLFVFVDWSEYAQRGKHIFRDAEAKFATKPTDQQVSWWIVDISSIDVPVGPVLQRWLTLQEQRGKARLFPGVATGNGSVLWVKRGELVGFDLSAQRAGLEALVHRAEEMLADS